MISAFKVRIHLSLRAVIIFALVLISTGEWVDSCLSAESKGADLLGNWIWRDQHPNSNIGSSIDGTKSFSKLEFLSASRIAGFSYLAHAFGTRGGEALESGSGTYTIKGGQLTIKSPPKNKIDGWPDRNGNYYSVYHCIIKMSHRQTSFSLSNCPLNGLWVRESLRS